MSAHIIGHRTGDLSILRGRSREYTDNFEHRIRRILYQTSDFEFSQTSFWCLLTVHFRMQNRSAPIKSEATSQIGSRARDASWFVEVELALASRSRRSLVDLCLAFSYLEMPDTDQHAAPARGQAGCGFTGEIIPYCPYTS